MKLSFYDIVKTLSATSNAFIQTKILKYMF